MSTPAPRLPWRSLAAVAALALSLLAAGTHETQSAWTVGGLSGTHTARSGTLAFTHTYPSTTCSLGARTGGSQACSGSIAPTTGATGSGVSATDTITNNGNLGGSALQAEVRAPSCGPVQLANRVAAASANPLLPRHGTAFQTSGGPMDSVGYVALDGAAPGGYATSVVAATQPGGGVLSAGTLSGVGVWFKAASGTTGPLLSYSASPSNGTGSADRALYLDAAGKLSLVWNTTGSAIGPSTSAYTDGQWHFAYMTYGGVNVTTLGVIPQVTLWVDGAQQATTSTLTLLSPMTPYSGYWHLGWAPTSVTGSGTAYAVVSLSNFVVINSGTIPSGTTIGKPTTQAAFNTATSAATDHWLLNDTGTATFAGTLPSSMTTPCAKVSLDWAFTNPATTVAASMPLSTLADGTWRPVTAPAAVGSQTSTLTVKQGTGYGTDLAGLHLYAPLSYRVQTTPTGSPWTQTFTWSGPEAAFIS